MKDINLGILNIEGQQYNLIIEVPDDFIATSHEVNKAAAKHFTALLDAHKATWGKNTPFWSKKKPFPLSQAVFNDNGTTFKDSNKTQTHDANAKQHWENFKKLFQRAVSEVHAQPHSSQTHSSPHVDAGAASAHSSPAGSPLSAASLSGSNSPLAASAARHAAHSAHPHHHPAGHAPGASASSVTITEVTEDEEESNHSESVASGSGSVAGSAEPPASSAAATHAHKHKHSSHSHSPALEEDACRRASEPAARGTQSLLSKRVTPTDSRGSAEAAAPARAAAATQAATKAKCAECWNANKGRYMRILQAPSSTAALAATIAELTPTAAAPLRYIQETFNAQFAALQQKTKNKIDKELSLKESLKRHIAAQENEFRSQVTNNQGEK